MTTIVSRFQFIPNDVAVIVHISIIDGGGDDLSHDHKTMQPLLGPLNLALEMASAFTNARRFYNGRRERREPGLVELIHTRREFKPDDSYFFKDFFFEG